ncbi:MAG: discoidin domain-containing protein [Sedimentisphaerales bacterium]|nr:discoidin domain-containing protein [Sedimentisphaerales bacterium]
MFRKSVYLIIVVVLGLSITARADFDTVGVYDPTDEPHNNDVDQSGTFVSATGVAGPDNVIDLETFQALIGPAFESDAGGVVNGEAPGTLNGEDILAHYGINKVKTLTITNNSGHIKSVGEGNLNRLPTSGSSGFGKDNDSDTLFTIGNITGGAPGEVVTYFALTVLDRDDRTITPTVTAEFSDGSTVISTATMDGSQPPNDQDTFFGFVAPPGTGIVSVNFDLSNWSNMDDLAFITSVFNESKEQAKKPNPANQETDIQRDTVLSWKPGEFAATHNVYLGTDFDDVNNADASSPLLVGPGVDANNFDPGRLEFDQSYFWRVDEVNAAPDYTPFKGDVWSFTVESYSIAIPAESITATASSQSGNQGPENTISTAGLDADDLHSTDTANMWITAESDPGPVWIQYEFDKTYQLIEMPVWNYNGNSILALFGIKDVVVEYSLDGTNWEQVADVTQFTKAPGAEGYAYETVVNFNKAAAKYVRINANSSWGGDILASTQMGMSEVRFVAIPVAARKPDPDDQATNVAIDTTLSWRAGRNADEHKVYFNADEQSVIDGAALVTTTGQTSYGPLALNLGSTYYWRIDEVNNAEATPLWEGGAWSFTTQEYLAVEDFESYNDIPEGEEGSNLVYLTWVDGYDNPSVNGSTMGYTQGSSLETQTIHGGKQSVPLMYNNTTAGYSEVTVSTSDLAIGGNWAAVSPEFLSIWFYGDADNPATDRMYAEIDGAKKVYEGDLTAEQWQQWLIELASLNINLSNVGTVTIGFEKTGASGGEGTIFLDDIQLYKPQEQ